MSEHIKNDQEKIRCQLVNGFLIPIRVGKRFHPPFRKLRIYQILWKVDEDDDLEAHMKLPLEAVVSEWQYYGHYNLEIG